MSTLVPLEMHRLDDVTVVRWVGDLVDGDTASRLRTLVRQLTTDAPFVVLDLGGVGRIDSFGLGLLVRLRLTLQHEGGDLKLCAVPANVTRVLEVTRLWPTFDIRSDEATAVAAFAEPATRAPVSPDPRCDVLCCDGSPELLMYVRGVLRGAGILTAIATNISDADRLARARRPRVLVINGRLRSITTDPQGLRDVKSVVELAPDFSQRDPAEAARLLLDRVTAALA
jgi:anti-anti-sigma factor